MSAISPLHSSYCDAFTEDMDMTNCNPGLGPVTKEFQPLDDTYCGFLNLRIELRLLIYEHCLVSTSAWRIDLSAKSPREAHKNLHPALRGVMHGLAPNLLRPHCKVINQEATPVLHGRDNIIVRALAEWATTDRPFPQGLKWITTLTLLVPIHQHWCSRQLCKKGTFQLATPLFESLLNALPSATDLKTLEIEIASTHERETSGSCQQCEDWEARYSFLIKKNILNSIRDWTACRLGVEVRLMSPRPTATPREMKFYKTEHGVWDVRWRSINGGVLSTGSEN
ncbi:hypothetical protein NX059_011092 [Plenodomus lindquistii]|nr:hypothetical protein NX059_011092 [Plenodomus lindquistii]